MMRRFGPMSEGLFQQAEKIATIPYQVRVPTRDTRSTSTFAEAVMWMVMRSHLRVCATLIFACQLITPLSAQERAPSTTLPPYPEGSKITVQWEYSCPGGKACSFFCPGRGAASHVTKLTIYLGTTPSGSQETPAVFYEFSTTEIPRGTGFAIAVGLSTISCQVNGMTLDYSGPSKRGSPGAPTAAR
jgi:hypothetical protein